MPYLFPMKLNRLIKCFLVFFCQEINCNRIYLRFLLNICPKNHFNYIFVARKRKSRLIFLVAKVWKWQILVARVWAYQIRVAMFWLHHLRFGRESRDGSSWSRKSGNAKFFGLESLDMPKEQTRHTSWTSTRVISIPN